MSLIQVSLKDSVQIITLNHSSSLNALSTGMLEEIAITLANAENDEQIGCSVLYGGNKAFSCGSDIREMEGKTPIQVYYDKRTKFWEIIFNYKKPLIAAVNRMALGSGFELALMCDAIISDKNAVFGNPEINLGLIPGAYGSVLLPELLGHRLAFEWMATGAHINADEIMKAGLINKLVVPEQTLATAILLAGELNEKPRQALWFVKELTRQKYKSELANARKMERMMFSLLFSTENTQEGIAAYIEKRKAKFIL